MNFPRLCNFDENCQKIINSDVFVLPLSVLDEKSRKLLKAKLCFWSREKCKNSKTWPNDNFGDSYKWPNAHAYYYYDYISKEQEN